MKYLLKLAFLALAFSYSASVQAQSKSKMPKWMCGKGFWVIQSNLHTPRNSTIFFYTNERELVYKEIVTGKRINTKKTKTRKHLEAVLNHSITAWQKEGVVKENRQLVASKE